MMWQKRGVVVLVAMALVIGLAASAFAIEAFQERFEWGDMSKPVELTGRVIVTDPYDKAVWISVAVFGGNAESGYYWQKMHPGKTLKFYAANDGIFKKLQEYGRYGSGPAAMAKVPAASKTSMCKFTAQEVEQNKRVITKVEPANDVAGTPAKPRSIHSLRTTTQEKAIAEESWQNNRKMVYDVMIPGGKPIAGFIPNANEGMGVVTLDK